MSIEKSPSDSGRSSVSTKIFLIVAIFSLPIGVLAYLLAANYTPQIAAAQSEMNGDALQRPLMKALYGLTSAQNILQACDGGTCGAELTRQATLIRSGFEAAAGANTQVSEDLKTTPDELAKKNHKDLALDSLQSQWKGLASQSGNVSTAADRQELALGYERMANLVKQLISYAGDTSNLILDPDLDSYYMVDVTLLAMPQMINHISNTASSGHKLASGIGSAADQATLTYESALLAASLKRMAASNTMTFDADAASHGVSPTLQPKISAALGSYGTAIASYLSALKAVGENRSQITADALANQAAAAQKASLDYWEACDGELDTLLNMRIGDFQTSRIEALGFSALAVAIAAIIAVMLGRSITAPLQDLVRNLGPGATLLGVSVERIAEASQSQTPSPEESAIICEELNAHAENMRKAVLELARHVEGSSASAHLAGMENAGKGRS